MTEVIESNRYYLYNLMEDPYETKEVSKNFPEIIHKLKTELEHWKKETNYEYPKPNPAHKD